MVFKIFLSLDYKYQNLTSFPSQSFVRPPATHRKQMFPLAFNCTSIPTEKETDVAKNQSNSLLVRSVIFLTSH